MPQAPDIKAGPGTEALESLAQRRDPLVVELSGDGRMRAPRPETRALLRDRLRKAEVLPTSPGWGVVRSLVPPGEPDPPSDRTVVAAGMLGPQGIAIVDFIGFVANGYETGVLTAAHGELERSVYFLNGDVVWASTTAPQERLGEFLSRRGKITKQQLNQVLSRSLSCRIGEALVRLGFLASYELWAMLKAQLQEIFGSLVSTEQGMWSFSRVSPDALSSSQLQIPTQGLLVDALRRMDELKVYRQRVRSAQVLMQRMEGVTATPEQLERLKKDGVSDAQAVLDHLTNPASVTDLMRKLGASEFDITRCFYHLLRASLVELVPGTRNLPSKNPFDLQTSTEVAENYAMSVAEVFTTIDRARKSAELRERLERFLSDESGTGIHARLLGYVELTEDNELKIAPVLKGAEEISMNPRQISDALSELLFFLLFQAVELLGARVGDDLARRVKMISNMLPLDPEPGA